MTLFETERLIVKRFTISDGENFFLVNSNPEVMHFIRSTKSREESDAFLMENLGFYLNGSCLGRYAVFEKDSAGFLGTFSFLYLSGGMDFHLGYALLPHVWGKGFATELVQTGIGYFFANTRYKELFAITSAGNLASQHVLLKSGFYLRGKSVEDGQSLELFAMDRHKTASQADFTGK